MASERRSRDFWTRLVRESNREGSTVAVVAKRHSVSPRTLSWWRWRLSHDGDAGRRRARRRRRPRGEAESRDRGKAPVRVLPVELADELANEKAVETGSNVGWLELELDARLVLRFPIGTDPAYLGAVIRSLQAPC